MAASDRRMEDAVSPGSWGATRQQHHLGSAHLMGNDVPDCVPPDDIARVSQVNALPGDRVYYFQSSWEPTRPDVGRVSKSGSALILDGGRTDISTICLT